MAKIGLCFSHLLSLRATLPEKLASKKRSTRKKFRAPIHRECVLRQSKHCDLSREDAEKHTENTQTETETESLFGRILIGRRRTLPLCHYQQPVHRGHTSAGDIAVALPCWCSVASPFNLFNHQAPLICQEWNFSRSREFLGYITPVTKTTTTPSLPPISG